MLITKSNLLSAILIAVHVSTTIPIIVLHCPTPIKLGLLIACISNCVFNLRHYAWLQNETSITNLRLSTTKAFSGTICFEKATADSSYKNELPKLAHKLKNRNAYANKWLITTKNGENNLAKLCGNSIVTNKLLILNFKTDSKYRTSVICSDAMSADEFRKLKVLLMLCRHS